MLEAFGASDPGCVRANNEDYYLMAPAMGLYVVADGMGGAQAGECASKLATETLWEVVRQRANGTGAETLTKAFHEANHKVMEAASSDPALEGMGTTMVAALVKNGDLWIASVGDSRAYLFDHGELHAITQDQTWVNEVGRRLGIDEETLKTHPMRHVLTMAVGVGTPVRIRYYAVEVKPGDLMMLSSDGLHGVIGEDQILGILSDRGTLEAKCRALIEAANANGSPDNVTVVLIRTTK